MAKPWTIVTDNLTGYDLEDIETPQRREMACPSCEKTGIFTEKVLVKNLKMFGVSVVSVEPERRVYQCPFCQSAVEPPPDVALAPDDPRVAALKRRMAKAREDVDVWTRRADLAARAGDDVLAKEAQTVAEQNRETAENYAAEIAALTSTDGAGTASTTEKPSVVARKTPGGIKREEPSVDRDFAALKARLGSKPASAESATSTPPRKPAYEPEEQEVRDARIDREADDELSILKARLQGKSSFTSAAKTPEKSPGAAVAALANLANPLASGGTTDESPQSRDDLSWFRPRDESAVSDVDAYAPGASVGAGATEYVPSGAATEQSAMQASGTASKLRDDGAGDGDDDGDDPVAALKRKLKK